MRTVFVIVIVTFIFVEIKSRVRAAIHSELDRIGWPLFSEFDLRTERKDGTATDEEWNSFERCCLYEYVVPRQCGLPSRNCTKWQPAEDRRSALSRPLR